MGVLKIQLAEQGLIVAQKNTAASELIQIVSKETDIVSKEKAIGLSHLFLQEDNSKCTSEHCLGFLKLYTKYYIHITKNRSNTKSMIRSRK